MGGEPFTSPLWWWCQDAHTGYDPGWDHIYIFAEGGAEIGLDLLFEGGYFKRSTGVARVIFCPSIPANEPGGPVGYIDPGEPDIPTMVATRNYYIKFRAISYLVRNKSSDGVPRPSYAFNLANSDESRLAFLADRNYAWLPYTTDTYHDTGWNVWYLNGSTRFIKRDVLPANLTGINYGAYFGEFDKY